jgi:hypothetical protein
VVCNDCSAFKTLGALEFAFSLLAGAVALVKSVREVFAFAVTCLESFVIYEKEQDIVLQVKPQEYVYGRSYSEFVSLLRQTTDKQEDDAWVKLRLDWIMDTRTSLRYIF